MRIDLNTTLANPQWWSKNWLRLLGIGAGSGALAAFAVIFALSFFAPAGLALPAAFLAFHAILASSPIFIPVLGVIITMTSGFLSLSALFLGITNLPSVPAANAGAGEWSQPKKGAGATNYGTMDKTPAAAAGRSGGEQTVVNPLHVRSPSPAAAGGAGDGSAPDGAREVDRAARVAAAAHATASGGGLFVSVGGGAVAQAAVLGSSAAGGTAHEASEADGEAAAHDAERGHGAGGPAQIVTL